MLYLHIKSLDTNVGLLVGSLLRTQTCIFSSMLYNINYYIGNKCLVINASLTVSIAIIYLNDSSTQRSTFYMLSPDAEHKEIMCEPFTSWQRPNTPYLHTV